MSDDEKGFAADGRSLSAYPDSRRAEVFIVADVDIVLAKTIAAVDNAIDQIGLTSFHWKLFYLNGFGYTIDSVSTPVEEFFVFSSGWSWNLAFDPFQPALFKDANTGEQQQANYDDLEPIEDPFFTWDRSLIYPPFFLVSNLINKEAVPYMHKNLFQFFESRDAVRQIPPPIDATSNVQLSRSSSFLHVIQKTSRVNPQRMSPISLHSLAMSWKSQICSQL
ncbi:uncharacterized protein KY384_008011 [Bacidia gigantensis]|uniref:uncharacterized protein n=1 Tax=Bacidia gigantensis TaxID=2732470 RepID=UPI001D04A994|nr:uncharacterized protein KY384_008011 [Bacidia gigantensis]KAG8527267.1 hypothetical protein KY384_008011 [Bacidia gigantensis]